MEGGCRGEGSNTASVSARRAAAEHSNRSAYRKASEQSLHVALTGSSYDEPSATEFTPEYPETIRLLVADEGLHRAETMGTDGRQVALDACSIRPGGLIERKPTGVSGGLRIGRHGCRTPFPAQWPCLYNIANPSGIPH